MNTKKGQLVVIAVVSSLASAALGQGAASKSLSTERSQALAYSKAFAERFALPEPSPELQLSGGLYGMQLRLEIDPKSLAAYRCKLKVYADNSMAIAYPKDGISASRDTVTLAEHFIFDGNVNNKRWLSLDLADRRHFTNQDDFIRRAAIASPDLDLPKKGYWAELNYDAFYRDLFPGVAYIRFDSDCSAFAKAGNQKLQLWIEKAGGKDYRRSVIPDPNDFLKFDIPSAFFQAALDWVRRADEENRSRFRTLKK